MGYTRHNAILVTLSGHILRGESEIPTPDLDTFRANLPEAWQHLVIGPIKSLVNDYATFAFLPDGSKEGWDTSDDGDEYRKRFLDLFAYAYGDKSVPSDVLVVDARFGGGEPDAGYEPELVVTTNVPRVTVTGRQCEQED